MTISNWPLSERPREKLLAQGAKYLSDAELIAILLQTGIRGKTALDIARDLLIEFGSLKKLFLAASPPLYQKPGLGKAKYALLQAALELGRRFQEEPLPAGEILTDSTLTKRCLASRLKDYPHEVFACLFLDTQHRVICYEELFHGTLSEANIYPREVVKRALAHNAAKIILAHNHPSGNPTPSQADQDVTKLLKEALALIEVPLIDHIIIGGKNTLSFAEHGLL
jgi:DNA repair protein RadC